MGYPWCTNSRDGENGTGLAILLHCSYSLAFQSIVFSILRNIVSKYQMQRKVIKFITYIPLLNCLSTKIIRPLNACNAVMIS